MHRKFNLNPLNFVTPDSFSWEYALKTTGKEFKLLTDINTIPDYANGIRGGITRAVCHYVEANNKNIFGYDEQKKAHTLNILILIIITERLNHNYFLMMDLNMLEIYQCLHMTLL